MRASGFLFLGLLCSGMMLAPSAEAGSGIKKQGLASWYKMGTRTASGERYDPMGITAAHPSLPFGTKVRVTNPDSGNSVVVRINDRGPFTGGRIIDLSLGAAKAIGMVQAGVAPVKIDVVGAVAEAEQKAADEPETIEASAQPASNTHASPARWSHIDLAHR